MVFMGVFCNLLYPKGLVGESQKMRELRWSDRMPANPNLAPLETERLLLLGMACSY